MGKAAPKRGRPRDWSKRSTIIEAALRLFSEEGLDGVTIEAVAAEAGVSKVTLYSHFRDKASLFETVIAEERKRLHRDRIAVTTEPRDIRITLRQFGFQVVYFITRRKTVAINRLLLSQLHRYPELARSFFERELAQLRRDLARLLSLAADEGQLKMADAECAADQLISMLHGLAHFEQSFGLRRQPKSTEIEEHVSECVDMFLRAYAPSWGSE